MAKAPSTTVPQKPVKGVRREQERFVYYADKRGQWWGRRVVSQRGEPHSGKRFKTTQPRGTFRDRKGAWAKVSKGTVKPANAPALFKGRPDPRVRLTRKRRTTHDDAALRQFEMLLTTFTSAEWTLTKQEPIAAKIGRPVDPKTKKQEKGSMQGFRTVAMYRSSRPYVTTWFDLQDVMREAGNNPVMTKAFAGRRTAMHVGYFTSTNPKYQTQKDEKWTSPYLSRNFNTTVTQAEEKFDGWAQIYVTQDDDDGDGPESAIFAFQLMIE